MAIINVSHNRDYTVISNVMFKDKRLSLKARGLLATMLSLPKEWDFTTAGLVAILKDGKASVTSALEELEDCGYLVREQQRQEGGVFGKNVYTLYEKPQTDKPLAEKPLAEKPPTDNQPQLSTYKSSTYKSSKDLESTKDNKRVFSPFEELESKQFSEKITDAMKDWIKYKNERKEQYKETGFKSLLKRVENSVAEYGEDNVINVISDSMASNWKGICWDKLEKKKKTKPDNFGFMNIDV